MNGRFRALLPAVTLVVVACNPVSSGVNPSSSPRSSGAVAGAGSATAVVALVSGLNKPFAVAVADGSVWATEYEKGNLVRINPATNRVVARVHLGIHASHLLVQEGSVWVLDDVGAALYRVDAQNNRVVNEIPLRPAFNWRPTALASGGGALWVTVASNVASNVVAGQNRGVVVRIDTATGAQTITTIDGYAAGVAVAGGSVWVTTTEAEPWSIYRVDPSTNRVVAKVDTGHHVSGPVAYAEPDLWVANNDGYLTKIDSRTGAVVGDFEVGSPEWPAIVAAGNDLWLSAPLDNLVARFDAHAGAVTATYHTGSRPQGFAFGAGGLWVANYLDGTVAKLAITPTVAVGSS
jgi:streptogramin lyase